MIRSKRVSIIFAGCLVGVLLSFSGAKAGQSRGYSIPLIDLASETHRQVVVDKESGQYLGHPTTVLLEDNKTMIAVYPKGHGRGGIVMKRSTDAGLTWSDRLPVPDNWSTSQEVPTIHRVIDPQGVKRLIMFSGLYPIRMAVSEDDGKTWTGLEPIGDFGGIVTMGSLVRLKNGNYMALFHDDGRFLRGAGKRTKFHVFKTISTDGGLTWGEPEIIAQHPTAHLCEPGAVRSPDGSQIALLLRENSRKQNAFVIFSNDEGRTWTEPAELPGALTGDRHTCRYAPDGRLFITFRDMTHESPTRGDWVGWVGRYEDIFNSREGQYRIRLMDNHLRTDYAYPGLELLPDGTFVTTTYGHWIEGESPFIVSVRFKMEEIDAKARAMNPYRQRRPTPALEFRKISDRLYETVGGRGSRGGVCIGDNGVLVIDSKSDRKTVDQVIEGIRKITDKPIKYVVNTHSDGDHVAGNVYFPETATFIAHENCRKDFFLPGRNGAPSAWSRPELSPFVPSVTFGDRMVVHMGLKQVQLWYFGVGHTTGDIVLYFPEEEAAFLGDQIFLDRPQLIHAHKNGNSFEHVKTLTRMLETINAKKFYSGHSEMTDRDGIRKHIAQMKKRQEKIKALIARGKNTEEIKAEFEGSEARLIETICNELKR